AGLCPKEVGIASCLRWIKNDLNDVSDLGVHVVRNWNCKLIRHEPTFLQDPIGRFPHFHTETITWDKAMAHCAPQQLQNISSSASLRSVSYGTTISPAVGQCATSTRRQQVAAAGPPLCLCHLFRAPYDPAQATGTLKGPGMLSPGEWPFCARGCRRTAGVKGAIPRRSADCGTISRDQDCSTALPLTSGAMSQSATIRLGCAPSVVLAPALNPRFPLAANSPSALTQMDATQIERNFSAAMPELQQQLATVGSLDPGRGDTEEASRTAAAVVPVAIPTATPAAEMEGRIESEPGSPSHPSAADGSLAVFQGPVAARRSQQAGGLAANDRLRDDMPTATAATSLGSGPSSPSLSPPTSQTRPQHNRQPIQQLQRWQSADSASAFGRRPALGSAHAASPVQSTTATGAARQLGGEELSPEPQIRTNCTFSEGLSTGRHDTTVLALSLRPHDTGQGTGSSAAGTRGSRSLRRPARDSMAMAALNIARRSDAGRAGQNRVEGSSRGSCGNHDSGSGCNPSKPGLRGGTRATLGLERPQGGSRDGRSGSGGQNVPVAPAAVALAVAADAAAAAAMDDVGDRADGMSGAARVSGGPIRSKQSRQEAIESPTSPPPSSLVGKSSPFQRPSPMETCSTSPRRRQQQVPHRQQQQRQQQQQQQEEEASGRQWLERSGSAAAPHGSVAVTLAQLDDDSLHRNGSETSCNPRVGNGSVPPSSASSPTRARERQLTDVSAQQRMRKAERPARSLRRETQKLKQTCYETLNHSLLAAEADNERAQSCAATREVSLAAAATAAAVAAAASSVTPSLAVDAAPDAEAEAEAAENPALSERLPSSPPSIASVQQAKAGSLGCEGAAVHALYDWSEYWDRTAGRGSDASDSENDSGEPSTSYDSTIVPLGQPPSGWRRRRMIRLFPVPRPHRRKRRVLARAAVAAAAATAVAATLTPTSVPSGDAMDATNGLGARRGRERFSFPFTVSRTSDAPIGFGCHSNGPPPSLLPSSLLARPPLLQAQLQDLPQQLFAFGKEDGPPQTDPGVIAAAVGSTGAEVAPVKPEWLHVSAHPGPFARKSGQGSCNGPAGEVAPESAAGSGAMLGTGRLAAQRTAASAFLEVAALPPPSSVPLPTTTDAASSYSLLAAPPFVLFAEAVPEHRVVVYRYRPTGRWVWQPLVRVTSANCMGRDLVAVTIPTVPAAVAPGKAATMAKPAVDGAALDYSGAISPVELYLAVYPPAGVPHAADDGGSDVPTAKVEGFEPQPAAAAAAGTHPLPPLQPPGNDQNRAGRIDPGSGGGGGVFAASANRFSVGSAAQAGVPKLHGDRRGGGCRPAALTSVAALVAGAVDSAVVSVPMPSLELTRPGHYLLTSSLTHGSHCGAATGLSGSECGGAIVDSNHGGSSCGMDIRGGRAAGQVYLIPAAAAEPPPSAGSSTAKASAAQSASQGPAPAPAAEAAAAAQAPMDWTPLSVLTALSPSCPTPAVLSNRENGQLETQNPCHSPHSSPLLHHSRPQPPAASAVATELTANTVAAAVEGEGRPHGSCSGGRASLTAGGSTTATATATATDTATAASPGLRLTAQPVLRHDVVLVLDGSSFMGETLWDDGNHWVVDLVCIISIN
ncbi:hypothetical protein VaNZ11_004933, partial [Volvox africanus]